MRRVQLVELEDLSWFPRFMRAAMTRYLAVAVSKSGLPVEWAKKLATLAPPEGVFRIVDLGSGSGGAMRSIISELQRHGCLPEITLTDLYPDPCSLVVGLQDKVTYWHSPVNAVSVPSDLVGTRTLFLSFHHQPPERARAILSDAFENRVGIAVFEFSARKPAMILGCLLAPLAVLLFTPLIRPIRVSQLVFTYLIPLIPASMFWDAFVSHLRTYSPAELEMLVADMQSPDYVWEVGELSTKVMGGSYPWLTGRLQVPR